MEVEFNPVKEPSKRHAAVRPSEDSTSDSDPGWSDVSDHSDFTTVRRRKTSRTKPEAAFLTQATDGSTYFRVTSKTKKVTNHLPPNRPSRFMTLQRAGRNFPSLPQPHKGR
ncbi:hypothetical protein EVAR_100955_1 [Eumeta japonica]|uniref:Uncharacterized protein n=1 Tax=Eumeta variegata TaxID=151549 RepID=A0A4C2A3D1_EUMVA|nr:hypothetical protein EVAR_100955_1 [Eumeta japonica]